MASFTSRLSKHSPLPDRAGKKLPFYPKTGCKSEKTVKVTLPYSTLHLYECQVLLYRPSITSPLLRATIRWQFGNGTLETTKTKKCPYALSKNSKNSFWRRFWREGEAGKWLSNLVNAQFRKCALKKELQFKLQLLGLGNTPGGKRSQPEIPNTNLTFVVKGQERLRQIPQHIPRLIHSVWYFC